MKTPKIAVVILNWNGKKHLETYIPSVVANSVGENIEIIVGDNASTDNSVAFLAEHYPQIRVICNDKNYGYAGGYNEVLKRVTADYYVLINSDIEVSPGWIEPMLKVLQADECLAAVQPKIKDWKDRERFEYAGAAGGQLDFLGYPFCRGRLFNALEEDKGQYEENAEIFWASGAAFMIKAPLFWEAGGFDADFFAHMEEIDLCWKLKNLGYKIGYCPRSVVYHLGGGTLKKDSPNKVYLNFRNNLILLCNNLPDSKVFIVIFVRFWLDLAAWFKFLSAGRLSHAFAINRAHSAFVFNLPRWLKKRRAVKRNYKADLYPKSVVWNYFVLGKKVL